jgi:hypothetical protein
MDKSRKIIIDTDVGWDYADGMIRLELLLPDIVDGFAIAIAIKKVLARDITIELINSTCGSKATAQHPSSLYEPFTVILRHADFSS